MARMPAEMATLELIGPTGLFHDDVVRAGLFYQAPFVSYPARTHAAEEAYVMLMGTAQWQLYEEPFAPVPPGGTRLHPSFAPHATVTEAEPILAAWCWTGDIGFESYSI